MKNKFTLIKKTAIAALMLVIFMTYFVSATNDAYVTENDPLVSLSYIENVLTPSIKSYVDGKVTDVSAEGVAASLMESSDFRDYISGIVKEELKNYSFSGSVSGSAEFSSVTLSAGQKITALGKCEMILQSGSCTVFGPVSSGAVKDLSAGKTLKSGSSLTVGNYVEISYADGSGIASLRAGTSLLIRGEYTVAEQ